MDVKATVMACILSSMLLEPAAQCGPVLISQNKPLTELAPAEAFDGPGCWGMGDRFFATGNSTSIDSLGPEKGKRVEQEFAEDDARARIGREAARTGDPNVDEDSHDITCDVKGFQVAAVYRLNGREGLFLVGTAKKDAVKVLCSFNVVKARQNAKEAFESANYPKAARLFAALTQNGAQDAETTGFAQAASAHVNINAGISGEKRIESLKLLAEFYVKRRDDEKALKYSYEIYQATLEPERFLLERLVDLSTKTHRNNNAAAFQKEISRRWPKSSSP